MTAWLTLIGMGEQGFEALAPRRRAEIETASTVMAHPRLLAMLPEVEGQDRIDWTPPLADMLASLDARRGHETVLLATGDPLWFGIGATLAGRYREGEFVVHPAPSAFQFAAARLGWPLQNVATLSLHGRPVETLHPHLLPKNRILALTADAGTAHAVADILQARGYGDSVMTALCDLGGPRETVHAAPAHAWADADIGDFYVLAIDCVAGPDAALLPAVPGLPDSAFLSDGQLTKREIRAATLAKLAPYPGALLWDVGAGCGSVGIEWMRAAQRSRAIAFEREGERLQVIAVNAAALGVPGLSIVSGDAPENFAGQMAPDAVFLGGAVGDDAIFAAAWDALRSGGRLVANAVTIEGETALYRRQAELGGELARLDVSVLDSVGPHRVLRPRMAVTQYLVQKP